MILIIGSVSIPNRAALDLTQTYEPIGGDTLLRTLSGLGIKQVTWKKTRTTITSSGWIPPGLATIDPASQINIACIVPRAIACDASRQATLPAERRADAGHTPWAFALMADGGIVSTPVSIVGNVATATSVANAIGYQVLYLPLLTCWVNRPVESGARADATYQWTLTAEEI
jgi:hypothetical protein